MPRYHIPSLPRLGARLIAAAAASLLFLAGGAFLSESGQQIMTSKKLEELVPVLILVPLSVALLVAGGVNLQYAWRGWAEPVERRGRRILRLGGLGFCLWLAICIAAISAWYAIVKHRDAGLVAILFAGFTTPIGALIGGIYGGMTAHRRAPALPNDATPPVDGTPED